MGRGCAHAGRRTHHPAGVPPRGDSATRPAAVRVDPDERDRCALGRRPTRRPARRVRRSLSSRMPSTRDERRTSDSDVVAARDEAPSTHGPRRSSCRDRTCTRCFDQASMRSLTLVSAPTGYGKTTLVSSWAHGDGCDGRVAHPGVRRQRPGAVPAVHRGGPDARRGHHSVRRPSGRPRLPEPTSRGP